MTYRVIIQPQAHQDIANAYAWFFSQSPQAAGRWLTGLQKSIDSLKTMPHRCPVAPDAHVFPEEVRQLLYGKRLSIYRILFTID